MDLIHLFLRKEQIATIALDDVGIYLLSLEKKGKAVQLLTHGTIGLDAGTIEEGGLVNVRRFSEKLQTLRRAAKPLPVASPFCMASLPSSLFHFQTFTFPQAFSERKMQEHVATQLGFALPLATDLIYFDWEYVPPRTAGRREIFFVWARRSAIDPYLAAFRDAHCIPLAIEPHYVSILRTLVFPQDTVRYIAILQRTEMTTIVYDHGGVRFMRVTPWSRHQLAKATSVGADGAYSAEVYCAITIDEIRRTALFYESDNALSPDGRSMTLIPLFPLPDISAAVADETQIPHVPPVLVPSLVAFSAMKEPHRTQPIIGVALRALIPRGDDRMVSIMPVGTEALHRRTRALAFMRFVHDFATLLGFFFAAGYILLAVGVFLFVRNDARHAASQNNFTLPKDVGAWERDAKTFNITVDALAVIHRRRPSWGAFLRTVFQELPQELTITAFSVRPSSTEITLTGSADDIEAFLRLKKTIAASPVLEGTVDVPLNAVLNPGRIPFSLTLKVKNYEQILFVE